jgi:hypothetical protein
MAVVEQERTERLSVGICTNRPTQRQCHCTRRTVPTARHRWTPASSLCPSKSLTAACGFSSRSPIRGPQTLLPLPLLLRTRTQPTRHSLSLHKPPPSLSPPRSLLPQAPTQWELLLQHLQFRISHSHSHNNNSRSMHRPWTTNNAAPYLLSGLYTLFFFLVLPPIFLSRTI